MDKKPQSKMGGNSEKHTEQKKYFEREGGHAATAEESSNGEGVLWTGAWVEKMELPSDFESREGKRCRYVF